MNQTAYSDFILALSKLTNPPKNREVIVPNKYKFEYADLASILGMARPILGQHNLAVIQPIAIDEGKITVETQILHASGTIVAQCKLSVKDPGSPQAQGSQITYLRRYGIASLLGIAAEDDDDGAAAATHQQKGQSQPQPARAENKPPEPSRRVVQPAEQAQVNAWRISSGKEPLERLQPDQLADFWAWFDKKGKAQLENWKMKAQGEAK